MSEEGLSFMPMYSKGYGLIDSGLRFADRFDAEQWVLAYSRANRDVTLAAVVPTGDEPNQTKEVA